MKLKYNFVTRNVDGNLVAVAVGSDSASFRGMIKLNETGGVIFEMLSRDTTVEEIADCICRKFDVSEDTALGEVREFTDGLRGRGLIED